MQIVRSGSRVDDGQWHHAVGTHAGDTLTLVLDGVEQGSSWSPAQDHGGAFVLGGADVGWGGWPDAPPSDHLEGELDDFSSYPHALTVEQAQAHHAAAAGPGYVDAVLADAPDLFWRLDEPADSPTALDSSGGTAYGS